jgi:hypothetical protein
MEDLSEKYDERTLRLIIQTLLESGVKYDAEFDDDMCDEIDDALKYIGINPKHWEDYGFYIQLIKINPNYETERIIVPSLSKYDVDINVTTYETALETWRHSIHSYFNSKELVKQQVTNYSDYSFWEGKMIYREVYDSSHENERVTNIVRVEDRNKK